MLRHIKDFALWMISALALPVSLGILFLNLTYVAPDVSRLSHPMADETPTVDTSIAHIQVDRAAVNKL